MSKSLVGKKFKSVRKTMLILFIGFLIGVVAVEFLHEKRTHETKEAKQLIRKIITSAVEQTDFYKKHSNQEGLEAIEKYAKDLSPNFEVIDIDYSLGYCQFEIIFDTGKMFYTDISIYDDNDFYLGIFEPRNWNRIKTINNGTQGKGTEISERDLTKKQIVQIAKKVLHERYGAEKYGLDVNNCRIKYDKKNKIFNKYYLEYYPNLVGHSYQAVCFNPVGQLQIGGGPYWICIDRKTGEVLMTDVGM